LNPKFFRNGIVMLVLVVGTAALLFTWLSASSNTADVSYSDFLSRVQSGQVEKVVQQDSTLTVTPKSGGTQYTVVAPGLAGLHDVYADIKAAADRGNVKLANDAYSVKPVPDTSWLGLLLTGLLPLLVIGGFIFFMMRQAQGTNNQALSFG
jgi:cell division protease FtsH